MPGESATSHGGVSHEAYRKVRASVRIGTARMGRTAARAHMAHLQGHTRKAPLTTNVPHPAFLPPRTGWSNKEEALTSPAQKGYARIGSTLRRPGAEFLHRYFEFYPQDGLSPSKELRRTTPGRSSLLRRQKASPPSSRRPRRRRLRTSIGTRSRSCRVLRRACASPSRRRIWRMCSRIAASTSTTRSTSATAEVLCRWSSLTTLSTTSASLLLSCRRARTGYTGLPRGWGCGTTRWAAASGKLAMSSSSDRLSRSSRYTHARPHTHAYAFISP